MPRLDGDLDGDLFRHPYYAGDRGTFRFGVTQIRTYAPPEKWVEEHLCRTDSHRVQQVHSYWVEGYNVLIDKWQSTYEIFQHRDILPYFVPEEEQEGEEFQQVATKYATVQGMGRLYRVTDISYIDDMGRWYIYNKSRNLLFFTQVSLTRGSSYRNRRKIYNYQGEYLELPIYVAAGLAGLYPSIQSTLMVSNRVDFHHMNENLWDIRPENIAPIPVWVHRDFHYPKDRGFYSRVFSKRIKWYLLVFAAT